MTTSKANITTLANEILLSIFDYLDHSSLANLNRTSRHFHAVTRSILYRTFVGSKYGRFLRTIVSSSSSDNSLGRLVKSANCIVAQPDDLTEGLTSSEREDIYNAFRELDLPHAAYQGDLASDFMIYGNAIYFQFHWYLDFFVLFFPQLETLEVSGDLGLWEGQQSWFGFHVVSEEGYFSNLRTVKIDGDVTFRNIEMILRIPALRELDLNKVREPREPVAAVWNWTSQSHAAEGAKTENKKSELETLRIRNSELRTDTLVPILQSIRGLRRFEYDQTGHDDRSAEIIRHNREYRELIDKLIAHASTLEVFRIRIWCEGSGEYALGLLRLLIDWVNFPIDPTDGSHAPTFPHLRALDLGTLRLRESSPVDVLVRCIMQHLPRGLKTLRLAIEEVEHVDAPMGLEAEFLNHIIDQGAFAGMGIEEVSISSRLCLEHSDWALFGGRKRVENAFRKAGVRFINACTHLCTKQKPPHGQIAYEDNMGDDTD